ncbi:MAG TPA: tetratricopeptide repeat protein, partial [Dongiaceae bacterium]|nr:tetratricopeptide repeat protein [Dongiaceae bacterium]
MEGRDHLKALEEYATAARLAPENLEVVYWHAVALVNMQRLDDALPLFRSVFARDRNWIELTPRLVAAELLPNDPRLIERICAAGN